jgi:hypothetical protein
MSRSSSASFSSAQSGDSGRGPAGVQLHSVSLLKLPTVTLCAATSVNLSATLGALRACLDQAEFAECLLFTDAVEFASDPAIRTVPIARLNSSQDYSKFILRELGDHIRTEHCLIVQWDGFILDAHQWTSDFLEYDYIGAPWPQFSDGHDVGNGGFSLRSRRLLEACRDPSFREEHPEDIAICRTNRALLESEHGIRFADRSTAGHFAIERTEATGPTFGFHGIFNMSDALGPDRFWQVYSTLDDRRTAFTDYGLLMRQLGRGRKPMARRARLTWDRAANFFS